MYVRYQGIILSNYETSLDTIILSFHRVQLIQACVHSIAD